MTKFKAQQLHEHVIEEIGKGIISGEFVQGESLPAEEQLCQMLGVRRAALREALRVLASKGLLEPKRKVGTLVKSSAHWNFLDANVLSWLLAAGDADRVISELYELRQLVEPVAASLAARHARTDHISVMRRAYEALRAAGDDGEKFAGPDLEFHQAIIGASGNRLFSALAHVIEAALRVNFRLVRDVPSGHVQSLPLHRRVLEAIEAGDTSAARLAMQRLIEDSQREARSVRRSGARRVGAPTRKPARVR